MILACQRYRLGALPRHAVRRQVLRAHSSGVIGPLYFTYFDVSNDLIPNQSRPGWSSTPF